MATAMTTRPGQSVPNLAIVALAGFGGGVLALHFLRPDYSPVHDVISDYANGRYGSLMAASFVALGIGCLALTIGMYRIGPKGLTEAIGLAFLAVVTLGCFGASMFQIDPVGAHMSQTGLIHTLIALTSFTIMVPAFVLLSVGFKRDARWRPYHRLASLLAIAYGLTYAFHFAALFTGSAFVGATNRLSAAAMLAWLLSSAFALREVTADSP
jgi:hypothetical protein